MMSEITKSMAVWTIGHSL